MPQEDLQRKWFDHVRIEDLLTTEQNPIALKLPHTRELKNSFQRNRGIRENLEVNQKPGQR